MKYLFEPHHFEDVRGFKEVDSQTLDIIAKLASLQLDKIVQSWPVVYGNNFISNDESAFDIGSVWNITKLNDKTHKARLAFIEEIPKEPCKHEPVRDAFGGFMFLQTLQAFTCKHCGVELQATWSEKK